MGEIIVSGEQTRVLNEAVGAYFKDKVHNSPAEIEKTSRNECQNKL
jgi:hypothetical protein